MTAGAAVLLGCTGTPLEVIAAEPGAADAAVDAAGDAALDAAPGTECADGLATVQAGRYQVRHAATQRCLTAGPPIVVAGATANSVTLTACSDQPGSSWDIIALSDGAFHARNVALRWNLDIEQGFTEDGTRAVLFTPHQLDNQRFRLRFRRPRIFEIEPVHAPTRCLTGGELESSIWPCDADDARQDWLLVPPSCETP